jgi:hypothetical protein
MVLPEWEWAGLVGAMVTAHMNGVVEGEGEMEYALVMAYPLHTIHIQERPLETEHGVETLHGVRCCCITAFNGRHGTIGMSWGMAGGWACLLSSVDNAQRIDDSKYC